jgi:hypothetical protein
MQGTKVSVKKTIIFSAHYLAIASFQDSRTDQLVYAYADIVIEIY